MEMLNKGIAMSKNSYNQKQQKKNNKKTKNKITPWRDLLRRYFISVVFFPKTYNLSLIVRKQQSATWDHSTRAPD